MQKLAPAVRRVDRVAQRSLPLMGFFKEMQLDEGQKEGVWEKPTLEVGHASCISSLNQLLSRVQPQAHTHTHFYRRSLWLAGRVKTLICLALNNLCLTGRQGRRVYVSLAKEHGSVVVTEEDF